MAGRFSRLLNRDRFYCFWNTVKLFEYEPQVLILREIVINPVTKNKEPVLHAEYQHQVERHPDHPGNKSLEM